MAWAWEQLSECRAAGDKLTLLALAWRADESGVTVAGPRTLMDLTRLEERGLRRCLAVLIEQELIVRYPRKRKDGSDGSALTVLNLGEPLDVGSYEFTLGAPEGVVRRPPPGGHTGHPGVVGTPPPTVKNTYNSPALSRRESAEEKQLALDSAEPSPVMYRGKRVPAVIWEQAAALLGVFNEATGRRLGGRTMTGGPSPVVKQIIGAILARPEVAPDAWEAAVRNTVANPPRWIEGPVQIGHVFGERAAEWALANQGRVASARDPEKQKRVDEFMGALAALTGEEK